MSLAAINETVDSEFILVLSNERRLAAKYEADFQTQYQLMQFNL